MILKQKCPLCGVRHYLNEPHSFEDGQSSTTVEHAGWMVQVDGARCHCGHAWIPGDMSTRPQRCPKCKSRRWFE